MVTTRYSKKPYYCPKCMESFSEEEISRGKNNVPLCPNIHPNRSLRSRPRELKYKEVKYVDL